MPAHLEAIISYLGYRFSAATAYLVSGKDAKWAGGWTRRRPRGYQPGTVED